MITDAEIARLRELIHTKFTDHADSPADALNEQLQADHALAVFMRETGDQLLDELVAARDYIAELEAAQQTAIGTIRELMLKELRDESRPAKVRR